MDILNPILKSPKTWIALVALVQTIVFNIWPFFPPLIWGGIDVLAAAIIESMIINDVRKIKSDVKELKP